MISNLRSKLKQISPPSLQSINDSIVESVYSQRKAEKDSYDCFIKEREYPMPYRWGNSDLLDFTTIHPKTLLEVANIQPFQSIDMSEVLFLDTETTGLSGGAGTIPFLVGIGYFEKTCFHVRQYIIRDFDEEIYLLQNLGKLFQRYSTLITFNGKTFDLPLINSRFILNRFKHLMKDFIHIDLLYPSRRLWKMRLNSCSLSSLEINILGIKREDDIPGSQIPQRFFDYLKSGDFTILNNVMEHNEFDILSMVSLAVHICECYEEPENCQYDQDIFSMGKIYEKYGKIDEAIDCYQKALSSKIAGKAKLSLSLLYKKQKKIELAIPIWLDMIKNNQGGICPYIELAKHEEHYVRDYRRALDFTNQGIDYILVNGHHLIAEQELSFLNHRKKRLYKKIRGKEKNAL